MLKVCCLLLLLCATRAQQHSAYDQKLQDAIASAFPVEGAEIRARDYENELGITFDCDVERLKNTRPATNIHELKPADVDVVVAVGDSVTAGYGVACENLAGVPINNRGESWSIGGDEDLDTVITLTNAIRKYNPGVKGYSVLTGGTGNANAWMNRAIGGAIASGMPGQAADVVEKLKSDSRIDYENDWKVFTLLIGGNDLCSYCYDRDRYSPDNFEHHIRAALDVLHAEVPRMLVNLAPLFDISQLREFSTGLICDGLQAAMCGCAVADDNSELRLIQLEYAERMKNIALSGDYDTRDDFTVVIQPSMTAISDPPLDPDTGEVDKTWMSHDCFHPDRKSHQIMALNLWNTMLIPVPEKPDYPPADSLNLVFSCPTEENPYFSTNLNSRDRVAALYGSGESGEAGRTGVLAVLAAVLGACALMGLSVLGVAATRRRMHQRKDQNHKPREIGEQGQDNPACQEA